MSYLDDLVKDIENNPPEDKNGGHTNLMEDLVALTKEASEFEFDDFRNKKYATPKVELVNRLSALIENVKEGRYDN